MELSNLSVLQNGLLRQDWIFRLRMGSNILHKFGSHIFSTGNRLEFETDLQICPLMAILALALALKSKEKLVNQNHATLFLFWIPFSQKNRNIYL